MTNKKSGMEEYLSAVSRFLDCPAAKKKKVLNQIKLFLQDIPGIEHMTAEEIYEITDSPEELAEAYTGKVQIKKNAKLKRWLLLIFAVFTVMMIALATVFVIDAWKVNHGYRIESEASEGVFEAHTASEPSYIEVY